MTIDTRPLENNITLVTLAGRLIGSESRSLKNCLSELAEQGRNRIILDLTLVTVLDSSGLSTLVGIKNLATAAGGEFRLAAPHQAVLNVLRLTRFTRFFDLYETVEAALTTFPDEP